MTSELPDERVVKVSSVGTDIDPVLEERQYLGHRIINELLEIMGNSVLRS